MKHCMKPTACHATHTRHAALTAPLSPLLPVALPADCLAMPHLAHAGVAVVVALLYAAGTFLLTSADFDPNPLSKDLLALNSSAAPCKVGPVNPIKWHGDPSLSTAHTDVWPACIYPYAILLHHLQPPAAPDMSTPHPHPTPPTHTHTNTTSIHR
jgi:hypothetical protein